MTYWSWWVSGLALSGVMLFHWLTLHRMMAVSGRITDLVDRARHGSNEPEIEMTPEETLAAIAAATADEFGDDAATDAPAATVPAPPDHTPESVGVAASTGTTAPLEAALSPPPRTPTQHLLFLSGLVLGGALAVALAGDVTPTLGLDSPAFSIVTGGSPTLSAIVLAFGGVLVGFGTRMAGGCTSGHGLCGTSRMQPGSIVATMAFFGAGIATSFALGQLL